MKELKKLIEKLVELEPERFRIDGGLYQTLYVASFPTPMVLSEGVPIRDWHMGAIQFEIEQAIEARGWKWGRDPIDETYQVVIPEKGYTSEYWEWIEGHDSLISAYLAALGAQEVAA